MARKDPVSHLGRHIDGPPPRLVDEVLALGAPGLAQLRAIVADRPRWATDPVAVANAGLILARSRDSDAMPLLLAVIGEAELDGLVYARVLYGLERAPSPELGRALLALAVDEDRANDVAWVLSGCGLREDVIAERIRRLISVARGLGADAAARYGDPALVPALDAALDACLRNPDPTRFERTELNSVHAALVALDGDNGRTERILLWFSAQLGRAKHAMADRELELEALVGATRRGRG